MFYKCAVFFRKYFILKTWYNFGGQASSADWESARVVSPNTGIENDMVTVGLNGLG